MTVEYRELELGTAAGFWMRFILAVLATWRIAHLLVSEDGPWAILVRLRRWLGNSAIGQLLDCFGCVSLWIAAPVSFFLFRQLPELFFCWLALSGAAFLLERMHPEPLVIEHISDPAREGSNHGVLR